MVRALLGLALALCVGLNAAWADQAAKVKKDRGPKPAAKPAPKTPADNAARAAAAKRAAEQRAAMLRKLPPMARLSWYARHRASQVKARVAQIERELAGVRAGLAAAEKRLELARKAAAEAEKQAAEAVAKAEAESRALLAKRKAEYEARRKAAAEKRKAEVQARVAPLKKKPAQAKKPAPQKPAPTAKKVVVTVGARQKSGTGAVTYQAWGRYALPGYGSLRMESVQKEVKLSDQQKKKLEEISKKYYELMRQGYKVDWAKLRELPAEQRKQKYAELAEKRKQQAAAARKQVEQVLSPQQLAAYKAIELRRRGAGMLRSPTIVQKLGLSKEQQERLQKNQQELSRKVQELYRESGQKALGVLTPAQREKLKELTVQRSQ